jgi:hypothetical protein
MLRISNWLNSQQTACLQSRRPQKSFAKAYNAIPTQKQHSFLSFLLRCLTIAKRYIIRNETMAGISLEDLYIDNQFNYL